MRARRVIHNLDCSSGDDPACRVNDYAADRRIGGLRKSQRRSAKKKQQEGKETKTLQVGSPHGHGYGTDDGSFGIRMPQLNCVNDCDELIFELYAGRSRRGETEIERSSR